VTFPYTYPAEPLDRGVVVPGWDDPEETFDSVHPPEAGRDLARVVPRVPRRMNIRSEETIMPKMVEATELKERIARWAVDRVDPHVFAMVFSETDHASHRWWVEGDPPRELIDVYDLVDRTMGRLITDLVRDDDVVLVVSDHGSWPIHHFVHIAPLLAEGGFLARIDSPSARKPAAAWVPASGPGDNRDRSRRRFFARIDWARTKAFPLGDSLIATGIYINSPPFPTPAVDLDDYEDVRRRLTRFLAPVEHPDSGERVFETVARREDLYRGAALGLAPDVIVDGATGYSPQVGRMLDFRSLFSEVARGGHRREGIYAVSTGLGLDRQEPIEGLLSKVLAGMGFDVPDLRDRGDERMSEGYTAEEAGEIERRLQGLGYVE
jgi:predicted AlkP superfamily phosphohydrolase/phosphomutase